MVFSSSLFLLYFLPIFLVVYHLVPFKLKNYVILAASLFFYSWGAPVFVFILVGEVLVNFHIINILYKSQGATSTLVSETCHIAQLLARNNKPPSA